MATLWIIDGYNFIRNSRRFAELEAHQPEAGKEEALGWLADFSESTGEPVCVVFDAYSGLHRELRDKSKWGIQILESRGGYTADEEIQALSQEKGQGAIVVSSDREVFEAAVRAGASYLKSEEFEREVAKIFAKIDLGDDEEEFTRGSPKGLSFKAPKEKKKAYQILKKYQ